MKLRKISDITATLPFTEFDFMQKYRESFAVSELGRIYAQLPLKEMAEKIRSHFHKKHHQGNTPLFPPEGGGGTDVPQVLDLRNVLIISRN